MDRLLYLLPLLACPLSMGVMMWLMRRGGHSNEQPLISTPLDAVERVELENLRTAGRLQGRDRSSATEDVART